MDKSMTNGVLRTFATAVMVSSALISCAPAKEAEVTIRFGGGPARGDASVRQVAECSLPLWIAVRGPGMPRIRIPIQGAKLTSVGSYGTTLTAAYDIPDQTISVPAGPGRIFSIVGKSSFSSVASDPCPVGVHGYPIFGESEPVEISAEAADQSVDLSVLLSNERMQLGSFAPPSATTGFQRVTFDVSEFASEMSSCSITRMNVRDITVDGPEFTLTGKLGANVSTTFASTMTVGYLLPRRRYAIEFVGRSTGACAGAVKVIKLEYLTPVSDTLKGTTASPESSVHSATCAPRAGTSAGDLDAVCSRE